MELPTQTQSGQKNYWMMVTLVLVGLIVGFGISKIPAIRTDTASNTTSTVGTQPSSPPENQPPQEISLRDVTEEDHIRGAKNAKITLVEFSDTECPFCKRVHPTLQKVIENYPNDVRWVYRHFPLDSLHPIKARKEAEATECANELGGNEKFWAYLDRIFEVTPSNNQLDLEELPKIAESVGLNKKKFEECLKSGKYADHVAEDLADATSAGGNGTPYTVLITSDGNKYPISGAQPYEVFSQAVERALETK